LNEEFQRKNYKPKWNFEQSYPPHAGNWTAIITIDGRKYKGTSTNKKLAKEFVAKAALDENDWGK